MLSLLLLACSQDVSVPLVDEATLASGGPPPAVYLSVDPTVVAGQPLNIRTSLTDATGVRSVIVLASTALGQGPCDPRSGECLDLVGQRTTLDRRVTRNATWDVAWTPPVAAGTTVWLQAAMLDRGVVRYVDEPHQVDVLANVPGCTFAGSYDFNPAATVDDGSCDCPRVLRAHGPAELSRLAGCSGVELLTIDGAIGGAISLPDLAWADELTIGPATGVTALELPALERGRVSLDGVAGAFSLALPASQAVDLSATASPGLLSVGTPNGAAMAGLALLDNPSLAEMALGAGGEIGRVELIGNGALEEVHIGAAGVRLLRATNNPALRSIALAGALGIMELEVESNPALRSVDVAGARMNRLLVMGNGALEALRLPQLLSARLFELSYEPSLVTLDLSSLTTARQMLVHNTGIGALNLGALTEVQELYLMSNGSLGSVDAPALERGYVAITDNPSLCLTQVEPFASPPARLQVETSGNLCDL